MPSPTPFTICANSLQAEGCTAAAHRVRTEGKIARKLVETGLQLVGPASVFDGEEWVLEQSSDAAVVLDAMFSTDGDTIRFDVAGSRRYATFFLIYGNDGYDVISDYTVCPESDRIMGIVNDYVHKLEMDAV